MSNTIKPVAIQSTVYWANLTSKNELSGKYQADLSQLSDAAAEALESNGITVRDKGDERGRFITVKSNNPIKAYNTSGDEIGELVGNESKCKAVIGAYDWSFQGRKGRSASLLKMVVTDLNVYDPAAGGASVDVDMEAAL